MPEYKFTLPIITKQSTLPTISTGVGAGAGATATVKGTDTAGEIKLNIDPLGVPLANSILIRLTYNTPFPNKPGIVVISPANNRAANLSITGDVYVVCDLANFTIDCTGVLVAGTTYIWNYIVIGQEN